MVSVEPAQASSTTASDWAEALAEELILDAFSLKHADARALIGAKLRVLHQVGIGIGVERLSSAIDEDSSRESAKQ